MRISSGTTDGIPTRRAASGLNGNERRLPERGIPARSPRAREARKGWAALIKQVYEADPLCGPRCGAELKIIASIERHQTELIEKILRHCGLWEEHPARTPPGEPVCIEG